MCYRHNSCVVEVFLLFFGWSKAGEGWSRFQGLLFKDVLHPVNIIWNALIDSLQPHDMSVDGLRSLLSHQF